MLCAFAKNQKIFTAFFLFTCIFKSKPVQRSGAFQECRFEIFFSSSLTPAFKWVTTAKRSMIFPDKIITTLKSTPLHCQDQHHCIRTLKSYRWDLLLAVDLSGSTDPRHSPLGSADAQKMCWWLGILSTYIVTVALGKQGGCHSRWYAFWKVQSKQWKRTVCSSDTLSLPSIVLQLQASLLCMHEPSWAITSPCPAVFLCTSA